MAIYTTQHSMCARLCFVCFPLAILSDLVHQESFITHITLSYLSAIGLIKDSQIPGMEFLGRPLLQNVSAMYTPR